MFADVVGVVIVVKVVIADTLLSLTCQWPFQEPKLKVPTIYKAYVREHPHKIWPEKWYSTSILGS
jgi:hypothetical protein